MSIRENANFLLMPYIKNNYSLIIEEARNKDLSYEEFLDTLLAGEVELRKQNSLTRRIRQAHFPNNITFADFKLDHFPIEIKHKIKELQTLNFIDNNENIILIGNPGTGKTALSIALGMKACVEYKNVLFISVPLLLIEIKEAMSNNQLINYKRKFEHYDLVILDELGYCSFSKETGEVLFNLLSSRNEVGSIIITSNLAMDKWSEVFHDTVLTGAIVDRLANRAHMIDMSGESYRIKQTKEWLDKNEKKD